MRGAGEQINVIFWQIIEFELGLGEGSMHIFVSDGWVQGEEINVIIWQIIEFE